MDISKECVEVFSWRRHGLADTKISAEYVRRQCRRKSFFSAASGLREDVYLKDKIALDAGCGGGLKSNYLAHFGPKTVIGIDGSAPAIEAAVSLSRELGLKNTIYRQGYLENTQGVLGELGIKKVDFILNAQMIHHTSDWRRIARIFYQVLSEGGMLSISWLDPSINWGSYFWKNRISFALGKDKESRLRIGRSVFGWFDRRYNTTGLDWDSFYADRYSAFYKMITVNQMVSYLKSLGFTILESYPPIDAAEWLRQRKKAMPRGTGFLRGMLTAALRIKQFVSSGGGVRVIYCRKGRPDGEGR